MPRGCYCKAFRHSRALWHFQYNMTHEESVLLESRRRGAWEDQKPRPAGRERQRNNDNARLVRLSTDPGKPRSARALYLPIALRALSLSRRENVRRQGLRGSDFSAGDSVSGVEMSMLRCFETSTCNGYGVTHGSFISKQRHPDKKGSIRTAEPV